MRASVGSRTRWLLQPYPRYRAARSVSVLGSMMSAIAYSLLVLQMGGGAAEVGALSSCWMVTSLACRLPGGYLADLLDRRWIMITADAIRLAIVGAIPLTAALGHLTYAQLLVSAVLESAADAAFDPSAQAFLRDLVPRDRLPRALGQAAGFAAAADLFGPPLGGLCYGIAPMLPFAADAVSFGLSGVLLLSVRAAPQAGDGDPAAPATTGDPDRRVSAGFRWLVRRPLVMRVLIFSAFLNMVVPATIVVVVVLLHQRGMSAGAIGAVMACPGVGGVVGSLLSGRIIKVLSPARLYLCMGGAWAIGMAVFALTTSPWVFGPALLLMMLLSPAGGVTLGTITVSAAPPDLIGRVSTAEGLLSQSLASVGPLLGGLLLGALGATTLWLLLSGLCLLGSLATVGPMALAARTAPAADTSADAGEPAKATTSLSPETRHATVGLPARDPA